MSEHTPLHLIAFVGLVGSGKSTAVDYLASQNVPKITASSTEEIITQATHLADAGQHVVSLDDISSIEQYRALKHAFPGTVTTVALLVSKHERHSRMEAREQDPLTAHDVDAHDYEDVETHVKSGPIALADLFVTNDDSTEALHAKLDALLHDIAN